MSDWPDLDATFRSSISGIDRRPSVADLDAYEAAAGFRLPGDYRRLALQLGPGEFELPTGRYEIFTPGFPEAPLIDLGTINPPGRRSPKFDMGPNMVAAVGVERGADWIERTVVFAECSGYFKLYCWQPSEFGGPDGVEPVYFCDTVYNKVVPVAPTFRAWVEDFLIGGQFDREYLRGVDPATPPPLLPIIYCQHYWPD